jgi:hypothetical protein
VDLWAQDLSYAKISETLNAAGVRTPAGGARWYKSHVYRLLNSQDGVAAKGRR